MPRRDVATNTCGRAAMHFSLSYKSLFCIRSAQELPYGA
ncbi:hypothetical protein FHS94_003677 [Sphingomonas aerophila]|uniref:Uncharacterized protein n=1 Tax=Sphingomonas aerophila TaxID=1344948 RepID=A0A7W9BGG8_9SPHN|nr:hypothetical protein [Sphingomonas aerophila]